MKRSLLVFTALLFFLCAWNTAIAQTTVFSEDFTTSAGSTYTTAAGPIGTSPVWSFSRSGSDFGSRIANGNLTLTNDASGSGNYYGWGLAYTNNASFASPFTNVLASNSGVVSWSFNMRQIRSNPGGFTTTTYGSAFILAGTSGTTNVAGTGYAVLLGNSGSTDPVRLVRYSSGIRTYTTLIASNTAGLTDFGAQYLSIRVTYTPGTNTWQLFVRNDGTTGFQDPSSGTLTLQGSTTNSTYTASVLPITGCYWNGALSSAQTSIFDNIKVTVVTPTITSLSPSSKVAGTGAFTLTVTGANFVSGTSVIRWNGSNRTTTYISATQLSAAITAADVASAGTASITVANGNGVSNALSFVVDPAGVPAIALSATSLPAFTTVTGTASAAATYTVSAANLTADVGVSAPANFELSTNGTTFSNTLTLTRSGTTLVGQPVTVYVRVKASAPAGIYSGNVDHTTTGGTTRQLAVSGTVQAAQPTTQASGVTFTNVTSASFTVNWTNGNGTNRLVVIRSGSAVNAAPVDGISYSAQAVFGSGAEIGTGNYVVYNGTGNSVTVTSLAATTTYYVAVYEFNGSGTTENYLTSSSATGNRTTLNAPVGWQIYTANSVNTINFDATVDGVNLDSFEGDGLVPTSSTGALNSNAWAVTGFSDGNIAFGGTSAEDSDFDQGVSTGGVAETGLYAFETPQGTRALGIQAGGSDFNPGAVTLRFQNQTGTAITSLNIAYKVYVYNDQASAASFNFSHSGDNSTYSSVAGLNITSVAAAEPSPEWKAYYRVVTLTGLNIANNNYYYLRWTGTLASGSGDFDEFALDDIVAIANPTSVFASFAGTAESFVLMGNASLSADLAMNGNITFTSGKLDINSKTLSLGGTVTNTVTGGLKAGGLSNVTVNGAVSPTLSFDQTTPGTTNAVNNLTIASSGTNTTTISNAIAINGQLSVSANQTVDFLTNALTGALTAITNNGTVRTANTSALPLPTGKSWNGSGYVHYNAASAQQTIVVGTYNNLRSSSTGGAIAAGSLTVNGVLNLPSANPSATVGSLSMGTYTLSMGATAANTGQGDVTGIVSRTSIAANTLYTFGHEATSILFPGVGTLPTSMSLKITIGAAPTWRTGAINRVYDFIQNGGSGTKAVIKAHYLDSELNGNNEARLVDWAQIVSSNTVLEQGRSNYSTTDNFVELSNVNVGLYFTNTFGQVLLTLDESEAAVLTWNGSVSNSWTTAANWTPNATPSDNTTVIIPNAATTPNDPILNPTVLLGSLTIETGGILDAPADSQFTINNGPGAWINNGTFNPGTGTSRVIFTNLDATIAGVTNFNNITINAGAGLRPITNNVMRIAGTFVRNGNLFTGAIDNTVEYTGTNQVIASPTGTLPAYNDLIISGTGAVFPAALNVNGDLTLNQTVNFTGNTLTLNGTVDQSIAGTASASFDNLVVSKASGEVKLLNSAAVNGTLTLNSGNIVLGANNLTLGANPVAGSFSATSMIVTDAAGQVRHATTGPGAYTFPIGEKTSGADYSPITVNITAGSFSGAYVTVSVVDAKHPNNYSDDNYLSRYWRVVQTGITGAVATIAASYVPADVVGSEAAISAAELKGTFDQQTNPWIKFAPLSTNLLTAAAATLTSGQATRFTGITGANVTVQVTGYGTVCQNHPVTLMAEVTGGDAPYTYAWTNGLGSQSTASPSTAAVGTTTYSVTVKDRNGITATASADVTVAGASQGGTAGPNQAVCAGSTASDISLSGNVGNIVQWQSSTDAAFTNPTNIGNTSNTLTSAQIGALTQTTYFRAVIANATCEEAYSTTAAIVVKTTTWDGSAWSNGLPDNVSGVVFSGNFTATSDLSACTIIVTNNAVVNIPSGFDVTATGKVTVTSGSFTFENNANLIQVDNVQNEGNIIVKRNSSALMRQDYTLWSTPVAGQNLLAFSPLTLTNRFYTYNTQTNLYNTIAAPASTTFQVGRGYLIRVPNNHPTTPTIWHGQFEGVANNGDISVSLANFGAGQRFNAIGNPYPSPISMTSFVSDNSANITGTLYFWRKTNNAASPSYCSWTQGGGFVNNGEAQVYDPNGIIRTGQGFLVEASAAATSVSFHNSQRSGNNADQFFRQANELERHRIWLNATSGQGGFSQTLVGYIEGATLANDAGIDGKFFNDGSIQLYSLVEGEKFVIQGRPLPFSPLDVVPIGFKATDAGNYSISIDHVDGIFEQGQNVYLRDNAAGVTHDLGSGAYTFASQAGAFDDRFEVVYQSALGTGNPVSAEPHIVVYKQSEQLIVNSGNDTMETVRIFDAAGRLIAQKTGIGSAEVRFNASWANQVLVVQITLQDGRTTAKKIGI